MSVCKMVASLQQEEGAAAAGTCTNARELQVFLTYWPPWAFLTASWILRTTKGLRESQAFVCRPCYPSALPSTPWLGWDLRLVGKVGPYWVFMVRDSRLF